MESSAIPTNVEVDLAALERITILARRRALPLDDQALEAAAVLDAWLAPQQMALREFELSYLDLVEPGTVFQWIERGGRSAPA